MFEPREEKMSKGLDTIHHLAIQVKNVDQAVLWYTERFSCEVAYQDESWALLKFANTALALVVADQHPNHFAVLTDDLSAYPNVVVHRDGAESVYIPDLEGNQIEILKLPKQ